MTQFKHAMHTHSKDHFYETLESLTTHEDYSEGHKNTNQARALRFTQVSHTSI